MSKFKAQPIAKSAAAAIVALLDGPQTGPDLGIPTPLLKRAEDAGYIKVKGTKVHTDAEGNPKRGRPMTVWANTPRGRGKAQRILKAQEREAVAA